MITPAEQLADALAAGLFSDDADTRKRTRASLAAHSDPTVAAFFKADKRSYHAVADGTKLSKIAREFVALGADGPRFALSLLKALASRPHPWGGLFEPALRVALSFPGIEEEAFEALSGVEELHLPPPKKTLPRGLGRLRALKRLRILEGTVTRDDHVAELAGIPQRLAVELWVKNLNLALFHAAAQNVEGLFLRGAFSNVSDASPLRDWTHLERLGLDGTAVTDLSPLAPLSLTALRADETRVTDLSPLAAWPRLTELGLRRVPAQDFSPLRGLTALTYLDLGFTAVRDLDLLRECASLRTLHLWGTPVRSLEPLVGLPIETLDMNYTARPDLTPLTKIPSLKYLSIIGAADTTRGLDALIAARPDLQITR